VTDHATQGKVKSIHKNGSPTAVLGQTSIPVTSQATQNPQHQPCLPPLSFYRGADKSLAWPGRKQDTAKEYWDFRISHLWS